MGDQNSAPSLPEGKYKPLSSLKELIAAPKGNLRHERAESFLLHVFWEAPSLKAANELLAGLKQCANATHRDTPCVPTYFFRISTNDTEICVKSETVGEHPQILAARKKIQRGAPPQAVHAELKKRGIDIALLDADDATVLEESQQIHPVALEFTEVYLDEQSFMEHAGSRDYLDGYAIITNPAMHNRTPSTLRLGTPVARVVETILEPMLKEDVRPTPAGAVLWHQPEAPSHDTTGSFWSLDFLAEDRSVDDIVAALPESIRSVATTLLSFSHPLREGVVRVMFVLSSSNSVSSKETLTDLAAAVAPVRGEVHICEGLELCQQSHIVDDLRNALHSVGLNTVLVNVSPAVGYALHVKAAELIEKE